MIKTWQQRCLEHLDHGGIVTHQMIRDRMEEEIDELRQALSQPEQESVGACVTCGAPKSEWLVDAVNISTERVDGTVKREHDLWIAAACLKSTVEAAIKAGDWKVDGACDPTKDLQYLANCLSSTQARKWVGLSDEEINDWFFQRLKQAGSGWALDDVVRAVEAKLKEKNT